MVFLTQRLLWPLTALGQTFDLYQRAMASTQRVLDLLERTPSILSGARRPSARERCAASSPWSAWPSPTPGARRCSRT
jgi:ABC-type multidrug transport system fused ATPase/permease subunit